MRRDVLYQADTHDFRLLPAQRKMRPKERAASAGAALSLAANAEQPATATLHPFAPNEFTSPTMQSGAAPRLSIDIRE